MSELREIWSASSKALANLDPVSIRRIVAAKDRRKLDLAKELDDADAAKDIALSVLTDMFRESGRLKPAWDELAASDLTGDDVTDHVEAMFLYALREMQSCSSGEIVCFWDDHEQVLGRRLPRYAMEILRKTYLQRICPLSLAAFKGE